MCVNARMLPGSSNFGGRESKRAPVSGSYGPIVRPKVDIANLEAKTAENNSLRPRIALFLIEPYLGQLKTVLLDACDQEAGGAVTEGKLEDLVLRIAAAIRPRLEEGKVADYIPALACIDKRKFGLCVMTVEGEAFAAGDAAELFSIQSVSKVFTLTLALEKAGADLWSRVGREPSGTPFNSIVQLERERGIPRNPFINAGAIVVSDVILAGRPPSAAIAEISDLVRRLAGDPGIGIDPEVARSEAETGFRNASLAHFMKGFGNLESPVEHCLETYFHHCALRMNCLQLARAGLFLAAGGSDPLTGERYVGPESARRINALMLTCGHYDASGDFAFRVGLPGKSGVGGGILAIAPRRASVAVWSPGLNANGNSLAGSAALEILSKETGWSVF